MIYRKRSFIFLGLIIALSQCWQAHAEEPLLINDAPVETLVLSFVYGNSPWKTNEAAAELSIRAERNNNKLGIDEDSANTLARAFVEGATPDNFYQNNTGMLRPNNCRLNYESCGRVMELVTQSIGLKPHQEKSISAAALGIWEEGRSSQQQRS